MSTQSTIRFQHKADGLPSWQLYAELFEQGDCVYLEHDEVPAGVTMIGSRWGAVPVTVRLRLPTATAVGAVCGRYCDYRARSE